MSNGRPTGERGELGPWQAEIRCSARSQGVPAVLSAEKVIRREVNKVKDEKRTLQERRETGQHGGNFVSAVNKPEIDVLFLRWGRL
jgi:hypothetical protein